MKDVAHISQTNISIQMKGVVGCSSL